MGSPQITSCHKPSDDKLPQIPQDEIEGSIGELALLQLEAAEMVGLTCSGAKSCIEGAFKSAAS